MKQSSRRSLTGLHGNLALRVRNMVLLWLALGALIGAWTSPARGGLLDVVAGAIAGTLILTPLGAALGLLGGRHDETMIGALAGFILGSLAALGAGGDLAFLSCTGLLGGGLLGATLAGLFWRLPRQLMSFHVPNS